MKQFEAGGSTESRVEASPQSQPPPRPPPPSEQQFPQKSQPNNIFSQNLINCLLNTNYALAGDFIPKMRETGLTCRVHVGGAYLMYEYTNIDG